MKEEFNPANLWFTRTFQEEKKPKRKIYQGFCEGYVAYHDIYIDKIDWNDPTRRHRLEFDWKNEYKTVDVYIYPFFGKKEMGDNAVPASKLYSQTSSFTASVTVYSANVPLSDPPVPPPPPPPSGF
jgi:hypothetical protein